MLVSIFLQSLLLFTLFIRFNSVSTLKLTGEEHFPSLLLHSPAALAKLCLFFLSSSSNIMSKIFMEYI